MQTAIHAYVCTFSNSTLINGNRCENWIINNFVNTLMCTVQVISNASGYLVRI